MNPIEHYKDVNHAARICLRRSPPRPSIPTVPDHLWNLITPEQRQRTLATLSSVLLRHLDVLRDEKGVRDESSSVERKE
ncbi:MAG TPA: hypothetical protein PKA06_01700 [Gemmatales bacterium]|nr:hypothetical protein [Gemmatales bacterium]